MQRNLIFLACFFIPSIIGNLNCFAQTTDFSGQYPFVYYTPKDGLVNSRVRRIKQDSRGRMYFITYSGLSVYDGTQFKNYHKTDGLADELINDIAEVTVDSLLVATNTNKLNTLVKGKIGLYKTSNNFYPLINRFLKSSDGQWYVAADDGLFILSENHFVRLPLINGKGEDIGKYLDRIVEWKNFLFIIPWNIGDRGRMILYDKKNRRLADAYTKEKIYALLCDHNNHLWVNTGAGIKWVDEDALTKGTITLQELPPEYKNLLGNKIGNIFCDRKNNFFFYGGNTIFRISTDHQAQLISSDQGLKIGDAVDMYEDKEGVIWIATDGNGAIKWSGTETQLIHSFSNKTVNISGLCQQGDTTWFYNDPDKTIRYACENASGKYYLSVENFRPFNIYIDKSKLYLTDGRQIICVADKHSPAAYRKSEVVTLNMKNPVSFGSGIVDNYGAIIFYTDTKDGLFNLSVFKNKKIIFQHSISYTSDQLALDHKGRLWVITRDNHLMLFAIHPGKPSAYLQLIKDYAGELTVQAMRCITADNDDNIWLGTRANGLYQLQLDHLKIKSVNQYTTQNGLTDNFIYSLACDKSNNMWIGTQNGIDRISLKNGQYIIANPGRTNNLFQTITRLVTTTGFVWALTSEGSLVKISPKPADVFYQPQLFFTSLIVNGHQQPDSTAQFSHRQNNLSFSVAAPSFLDERSVRYSYHLEGSSNANWSVPSNNSTFNFINLSPGEYKLTVKADFPEAIYPSRTLSYSFTILPPWWQTWWFRILFSILIASLFSYIVRTYYTRKLEKQKIMLEKKQAVERERTRIATDMHDDLGAGLSRIKFLSEMIGIKKQQQQPIEEDISKIREYSHEMIDKMGEIVWALNEKNDSLNDLLSYTRSYAMDYLSQNAIGCQINIPDNPSPVFVSGEFRRNIFLSVKEALHNVVKHSQANEVSLTVSVDKQLTVSISDNGIGIDKRNIKPYSNGLHNIEKRMKDIKGFADIQNNIGTTVILKAPL